MTPLSDILEEHVSKVYYASERIRAQRLAKHEPTEETTIWHENKSGNISAYPYSCALRAGASYNYLLVNGERRLTCREMLRLQGFPDSFKIICSYTQGRKQAGNSLPVPVAQAVLFRLFSALGWHNGVYSQEIRAIDCVHSQMQLLETGPKYATKNEPTAAYC